MQIQDFRFTNPGYSINTTEDKTLKLHIKLANTELNLLHIFLYNKDLKGKPVKRSDISAPTAWKEDPSLAFNLFKRSAIALNKKIEECNDASILKDTLLSTLTSIDPLPLPDFHNWNKSPKIEHQFLTDPKLVEKFLSRLKAGEVSVFYCVSKKFHVLKETEPSALFLTMKLGTLRKTQLMKRNDKEVLCQTNFIQAVCCYVNTVSGLVRDNKENKLYVDSLIQELRSHYFHNSASVAVKLAFDLIVARFQNQGKLNDELRQSLEKHLYVNIYLDKMSITERSDLVMNILHSKVPMDQIINLVNHLVAVVDKIRVELLFEKSFS